MNSQSEYMEQVVAMILNFYFQTATDIDEYCGLPMLEVLDCRK